VLRRAGVEAGFVALVRAYVRGERRPEARLVALAESVVESEAAA
jgi:hypothetical protein